MQLLKIHQNDIINHIPIKEHKSAHRLWRESHPFLVYKITSEAEDSLGTEKAGIARYFLSSLFCVREELLIYLAPVENGVC